MEKNIAILYQKLFKEIEAWDIDKMLKKVQEMSGIDDKKYKDISFCTLLIFWTESTIKEVLKKVILNALKPEKQYPELIDLIFNETTFMAKIKIIEFIISYKYKREFKDFFSFCKELNNVRNQIFHTKLEAIKYKSLPISDVKTQRKMLTDLIEARQNFSDLGQS